jgi:hypothetical protein
MKHLVSRIPPLWLGLGLMLWALLMLGAILVALSSSPASQPAPAKVAAVGPTLPPVPVRPPPIERVTFRERWSPVSLPAMPAATVTPVTLVAPPPMRPEPAHVALLPQPEIEPGTPVRIIPREVERKAKTRGSGTCERHGLRQVWVSDRRWRCRR